MIVGAIGLGLALLNRMADRAEEAIGTVADTPGPPPPTPVTKDSTSSGSGSGKKPSAKATKAELYEIATELGIKGRSKMSKAELTKAIEQAS